MDIWTPSAPLSELIAEQALRTPEAVAVEDAGAGGSGARLNYAQLECRAEELAHRLCALGAGPGRRVGVCLRRSTDLVAVLLAVWKTGAAYVPLDPEHPAQRLSWILDDTGVTAVVTERASRGVLPELADVRTLLVDGNAAASEGAAEAREPVRADFAAHADDAAYVLHTSGSTGRPKGVVVTHAGIANRVRWLAERHGLGPGDRVLQKTTIGFDAAGLELFAPLLSGATVVLAPEGAERDPAVMLETVAAQRITVLQAVPSVLRALAGAPGWDRCGALRLLFSAGEPLHAELCHQLLALVPQVEIWNTYGPTECSVDITEHRFDPAQTRGPVPVGAPIGGLRCLVLDAQGEVVPPGGEGELYAAGAGVAQGYLGRPGATAERFVPDPGGPPGSRAYRTGDRVRLTADGVLEYRGRLDQQLKVNGVRIEPDEVEAALRTHPRVDDAVAGAVPDGVGGQRLVAWVQVRGTAPAAAELRVFLGEVLPRPLVPAVFVPLAAFPRTPSGKTDRAALPAPGTGGEVAGGEVVDGGFVQLRSADEKAVAGVWADLLSLPLSSLGAHDDFFARGGSSLLLAQLASRLHELGAPVGPRDLFTAATVETQAALVAAARAGGREAAPVVAYDPVVPVPRAEEGLPLSHGQQGLWLMEQMRPGSPEWVSPQWVRLPAAWSEPTVREALGRLADRHEILRTRYELAADGPVQLAQEPGGPVPLRVAEVADGAGLNALAREELATGFDLEEGPVWRAVLIPGGASVGELDADHLLLLTIHHIASDGWSSVLLERDLYVLGGALHADEEAELPLVPVQFADHAAWQHRTDPANAEGELAHWRSVLDGITPLELPADRPRPAERDGVGGMVTHAVPAALAESLTALGRSRGATLHQTLLTAFSVLLTRLTGRTDFTVGMPTAGRHRPEVAQTVGFFLNTLVLRCRTDADGTVLDALDSVRDTVLDAFAHQELPFDRLVQELEPERDLSRTPLYQVVFDFHEEGRTATAVPEAALGALKEGWRSARTDLSLVVQHQADGSLQGSAHYASALFDEATVQGFLTCWVHLLESFTEDPTAALATVELLPPDEHARLVALGAPDETDSSVDECTYTAFEEQVRRTPDVVALTCGGQEWTYADLEARAASFAYELRAAGAGPERTVAVLLPRSADLVAALFGVWRSGAACVPLDGGSPDERIAHIMSDARVTAVLTDELGAKRLEPFQQGEFVITDAIRGDASRAAATAGADRDPGRLAYLIYTSGTTGRPKGAAVEHRALVRALRAGGAHLRFGEGGDDAWLATAPVTFDIAFTELVMPLLAGGRIVLARDEETTDAPALLGLIDRHAVTHLQVGYPQWRMLIDAGLGDRPLIGQTGGEPCPPALARDLAGRLKRFVNEYGLTETTIAATRWEADTTADAVAVGRPYPHVTTHVLDPLLRPVPLGTVGELCIGGNGLFRGYAGSPGQTAGRLVPDPYGPSGSRLFMTGDLARMAGDGTLHFVGRADGQVKIRGRRVETGEVQAVLAEHPAVGEAVVVPRGRGDGARLVAYCVPATGQQLPYLGDLLDHCARSLPDHMLPTYIVPIEKLPLTRHRKVDIAALPDPGRTAEGGDESYVAPEGQLEENLARIWADVLAEPGGATPRVGARTGFFRIGGDSLRAARVIARVREEYDIRLAARTLFDQPTVAGLARAVEEAVLAQIAELTDAELADAHREFNS
ncbi:non-ribosomal peptide synthetase [Streptomyces lunaelactis]|uniref:non-ribosomal peptide synthetase n=3 Tax=Streptomyces lunaelactis TaxID=1535768 RepID=UPI0015859FE2|nr:non-ribosomal peptide synthetase [Streptomyces lunaelactis]NUK60335.1 amino acid adenylation domain-containing protein [Streptomyces lunaelactis]